MSQPADEQEWGLLLSIMRQARADRTAQYGALSVEGNADDARRRRVIEGILFSDCFVKTYHAALCGIIVLLAIWHWYGKWARRRRRALSRLAETAGSTSSKGITSGSSTPPEVRKSTNERTSLLGNGSHKSSGSRQSLLSRRIRSLGMWQPPNIPVANKVLPANFTTVLILFLFGLNVFYVTYNIHFETDLIFVFSDRTALIFVANLPWLYILAAKNQPLKLLTGYTYEGLNTLHRRLGEWMCLLAIVHGATTVAAWYLFFGPFGMSLWTFLTHRIILLGIGALLCYEILFMTSLKEFREWWYEMFLGSHIVLQALGLVFVFFHHPGGRPYTAIALAIFLIDRLVFRTALKSCLLRADLTVMEDDETVLLSADWPVMYRWARFWTFFFGMNIHYGWKPTEHVFISVPAMARKHMIQAHPFTIASSAPEDYQSHAWFNLIIRAHDGFTLDLLNHARAHLSARVRLDGPYGSMHALEMLRDSDISLLVVGGSGIAVAYPLLWTLLHEADAESARARRQVGLVWVVHEASHVDWIGHERLDELREKGLHVCIPPPTSKAGRPDVGALVQLTIEQLQDRAGLEDLKVGVVISGPDGLNRTARNACAWLAWQGVDVRTAVEKYGW